MRQIVRLSFICWFLIACLFFSYILSGPVNALEQDGFTYTISGDTVTITGYTSAEKQVVIPSALDGKQVVAIGDSAFSSKMISTVYIPDSVRTIGKAAFSNCTGLISVRFPARLDALGMSAFSGCSNLGLDGMTTVPVILPPGLTKIENSTFSQCRNLMDVTIPEGVTSIGQLAFYNCHLYRVIMPDSLTRIDVEAFRLNSSLSSVMIPGNVSYIGRDAFHETAWLDGASAEWLIVGQGQLLQYNGTAVNLVLPASVRRVCSRAFLSRSSLRTVHVPDQVTEIDYFAFANCSLTSIRIPPSVGIIQNQAFDFGNYGMTIQGYAGSTAESFAAARAYAFQALALVTFDTLGGTAVASQEKVTGSLLDLPQQPNRTGHQFAGWYREKSFATVWNFTINTITQNTNLYSRWLVPVPTGLQAARTSPTSVLLSWNSQSGIAGFEIYRAPAADGAYTFVYSQSGNSYLDSGLSPDKYYYQVLAWSQSSDVLFKSDRTQPLAVDPLPDPTPTLSPKPTETPKPTTTPVPTFSPSAPAPTATPASSMISATTITAVTTAIDQTSAATTYATQSTASVGTTEQQSEHQTESAITSTQENPTTRSDDITAADRRSTDLPWIWLIVFVILVGQSILIAILFRKRQAK